MKTPFPLTPLTEHDPLCGRVQEILDLCEAAVSGTPTLLCGPPLSGKSTVLDRVQSLLAQQGMTTIKVPLQGVGSARELAERLALAAARGLAESPSEDTSFPHMDLARVPSPLTGRPRTVATGDPAVSGTTCLQEVLGRLEELISRATGPVHLGLDNVEDLALLAAGEVEKALQDFLASSQVRLLIAGSRKADLLPMFSAKNRPLKALEVTRFSLAPLPYSELLGFIIFQFSRSGKTCPRSVAESVAEISCGIPYYAQRLAHHIFAATSQVPESEAVAAAAELILDGESPRYGRILAGLSPKQGCVLQALARSPQIPVFTSDFLKRNGLSHSTIQRILPKLQDMELIIRTDRSSKKYRVQDPFLAEWLRTLGRAV